VVLTRGGEGGAGELLSVLGADPNQIRSETQKQAWPKTGPGPRFEGRVRQGRLEELDFEE
jgi:hypothetical protein